MYKNIINKVVDQKVEQKNQNRVQHANQKRIENAKFNPSNLLVGYVSKMVSDSDNRLMQMMSYNPRVFIRVKEDILQDIETGKNYPLVFTNQTPKLNIMCVMEKNVEPFVSTCLDAFNEKGIDYNTIITKNQAKDILDRQRRLNTFAF